MKAFLGLLFPFGETPNSSGPVLYYYCCNLYFKKSEPSRCKHRARRQLRCLWGDSSIVMKGVCRVSASQSGPGFRLLLSVLELLAL